MNEPTNWIEHPYSGIDGWDPLAAAPDLVHHPFGKQRGAQVDMKIERKLLRGTGEIEGVRLGRRQICLNESSLVEDRQGGAPRFMRRQEKIHVRHRSLGGTVIERHSDGGALQDGHIGDVLEGFLYVFDGHDSVNSVAGLAAVAREQVRFEVLW